MAFFFKFFAEFMKIVNFSIEDEPNGLILIGNGLMTSGDIDDTEAAHAQANALAKIKSPVVRSAMTDNVPHLLKQGTPGLGSVNNVYDAENSAHNPYPATFCMPGLSDFLTLLSFS